MQEIPRALLLPPPSPQRSTRGTLQDSVSDDLLETGARRSAKASAAPNGFLTLVETRQEDRVEFTADARGAKQFRFRPYTNRGTTEAERESNTIERPATDQLAAPEESADDTARAVLDGFASGDGSRNSTAFVASFIVQEQLSEGLYNPPHGDASDAYRRAGGAPPVFDDNPRVVSFAA